eukprot:PITA_26475
MVEKRRGKSIKCLRTDNGGEFTSLQYEQYCNDEGIVRHKTVVYTCQKNGVVECMNQTLMERARSMINNANLQKKLQAEAISTAYYLVNRSPSVAINCKIPEEVWLWDPTSRKIFISRDVTFDESFVLKSNVERIEHEHVSPNRQIQLEARPFFESRKEGETYGGKGDEDTKEAIEFSEPVQRRVTLISTTRERKTPQMYEEYASSFVLITEDEEPSSYQEAVDDINSKKWKTAMEEEMDCLFKNNTWDLVELPERRSVVGCK